MEEATMAFSTIKIHISQPTLLAHPAPHARTTLTTDISSAAVSIVLQQEIYGQLVLITFFSLCLQAPLIKYSDCGHELLAIYLAVKHF